MNGSVLFPWYSKREYIEYIIRTLKHADVMLRAFSLIDFLSLIWFLQWLPKATSFRTVFRRFILKNGAPGTNSLFHLGPGTRLVTFSDNPMNRKNNINSCQSLSHSHRHRSNYDQYSSQNLLPPWHWRLSSSSERCWQWLRSSKLYPYFLSILTSNTSMWVENSRKGRKMERDILGVPMIWLALSQHILFVMFCQR